MLAQAINELQGVRQLGQRKHNEMSRQTSTLNPERQKLRHDSPLKRLPMKCVTHLELVKAAQGPLRKYCVMLCDEGVEHSLHKFENWNSTHQAPTVDKADFPRIEHEIHYLVCGDKII